MTWDWQELVSVVVAAAIGWLMRHLEVWRLPKE